MNLRDLSAEVMLTLSDRLLDPDRDLRPIMEQDPLLNGPCDVIEQAHGQLLTIQEKTGSNETKIQELTAEMTRLDARHDRLSRGTYLTLDGCITLSEDADEELEYRALQKTLYPKGRSIGQKSYREQAGTAKRVEQTLSDADRDRLQEISFGDRTLLDAVEDWLETASAIADKEARRARLRNDRDDDRVSAEEVRKARTYWIRAINSLVNMLEFTDLDESQKSDLLANIEDAVQSAAESRRRAQSQDSDDADAPADLDEDSDVVEPAQ